MTRDEYSPVFAVAAQRDSFGIPDGAWWVRPRLKMRGSITGLNQIAQEILLVLLFTFNNEKIQIGLKSRINY